MAAAFDAVAETYDEFYSTRADQADTGHITCKANLAYRGGGFVDLGCGPGTAVPYLTCPWQDYVGIDIAEKAVEVARARYPLYSFLQADETAISPGAAGFILGCFGPLQHVQDLDEFAFIIRRSLMHSGRFLLMGRPRVVATRVLASEALTCPYTAAEVRSAFSWARDLRTYAHRVRTPHWPPVLIQRTMLYWEEKLPSSGDESEWLVVEGMR